MQVPENGRAMMNGCPDVTARFSLDRSFEKSCKEGGVPARSGVFDEPWGTFSFTNADYCNF